MHELSIALSIVERVEEEIEQQGGGTVEVVHLRLGPLAGVVKEALQFSYQVACETSLLRGSALTIEDVPVVIFCAVCDAEQAPISAVQLRCASCGTAAERVVRGKEMELAAIELRQ